MEVKTAAAPIGPRAGTDGAPAGVAGSRVRRHPRSRRDQLDWRAAGWYGRSSGARLVASGVAVREIATQYFPGTRTSAVIDRRDPTTHRRRSDPVLSVAGQVREIQTALSINKSELARILRVSRPTVYDWLDDGEPNPANIARIQQLLKLLRSARASSANPLFPRHVKLAADDGTPAPITLLSEEEIDEQAALEALHRARAMADAIHRDRIERDSRRRAAGFRSVDLEQRKAILATNAALLDWPRE